MQNTANVSQRMEYWHCIDWYSVNRSIRNLRRRIFKATQNRDWKKVRSLQKLMLKSFANVLISVRKVTQTNKGKNTPGVDKILVKTPKARWELSQLLAKGINDHKPNPTKRVHILKKNGKTRPLGIPTIKDRAIQNIVKNALEHHKLIEIIGNFPKRNLIAKWLKAGYVDKNTFHPQDSGTPQGSIISPLLANIALHGMEAAIGVKYNHQGRCISKLSLVRYADDLAIFGESKEDTLIAKRKINEWLSTRGLKLSEEKTKIVHITQGFDFLGFNIKQYKVNNTKTGYKLLIKPSKEFIKKCKRDIREVFLNNIGNTVDNLIGKINPIIRGKANYVNKVVSKEIFSQLDYYQHMSKSKTPRVSEAG